MMLDRFKCGEEAVSVAHEPIVHRHQQSAALCGATTQCIRLRAVGMAMSMGMASPHSGDRRVSVCAQGSSPGLKLSSRF